MRRDKAFFDGVQAQILDVVSELRAGRMDAYLGLAIGTNFKALNDNLQVEINNRKMDLIETRGVLPIDPKLIR